MKNQNKTAAAQTMGTVISVKRIWWVKVNTKPVRLHSLDGAKFPHYIRATYQVEENAYVIGKWISWRDQCPQVGQAVTVRYSLSNPHKGEIQT